MLTSTSRLAALLFAAALPLSLSAQTGAPAPASSPASSATSPPVAARRITARRASQPIVLDGVLDEPAWASADRVGDFVQSEPQTGALATEATEVRILYDETTLYIGATLHDRNA